MSRNATVQVCLNPNIAPTDVELALLVGDREVKASLRIDRLAKRLVAQLSRIEH